jgi:antirestriction protein
MPTIATAAIDNTDDLIDVRDIIARIEELEDQDFTYELVTLRSLMDELEGLGGDEQWRGEWYPITLIRDSYFTDFARDLLEDCGDIPSNIPHYIEIDWERTARNIRIDYTPVEINGVTYWTR